MDVPARRVATTTAVSGAVVVLAADVVGAVLLASAVPYLGLLDVWLVPLVGVAYAAAAVFVTVSTSRRHGVAALVVAAGALGAPALALGLAQRSGAWVAVGALAACLPPAVLAVAVVALRGGTAGRPVRPALVAAAGLALLAWSIRTATYDPAVWGWCRCQPNPLSVGSGPDTWRTLEPWFTAVDAFAVVIVLATVGAALAGRPGRVGAPDVVVVAGAMLWGGAQLVVDCWSLVATDEAPPTVTWVAGAALLGVLTGFLLRAAARRPSRAHVADLLLAAREEHDPARLRELVARALGQPDASVLWWDGDAAAFRDHRGEHLAADQVPTGDHVLTVESEGRPIALVVGERTVTGDPSVLEPVAEALRLSTENRRLAEELQESLVQVRESRQRILTAADETRKRIERDLHDGAQQLLISTGVKLNLANAHVDPQADPELAEKLGSASDELGRALAELRQLAGGITPTTLVHGSLREALEELVLRSAVPTSLDVAGEQVVDQETAVAVYFVVAECLANVAKHADDASARVELVLADPVRVSVSDDGPGGADPTAGTGLRGLSDRVEARGGRLVVHDSPAGTTVTATLPLSTVEAGP